MNLQRIGFASQLEDGERVERSFRRPFYPMFFQFFMWTTVFGALFWAVWVYFPKILPMGNTSRWLVLLIVGFGFVRLLKVFWKWYGNVILMTSESLVFAEWNGFFSRKIVRLDYWDLDEVGLEREGAMTFLTGVGDLVFEKVNGGTSYIYKGVSRPKRAIKILRHHRGRMLDEKNFTEESALRNLLSQMVQTHVRKNGQPVRHGKEFLADGEFLETEKWRKDEGFLDDDEEVIDEEVVEIDFELDDDGGIEIDLK